MDISLNIILDKLSCHRYELHISLPTDLTFNRVSFLPRDMITAQSGFLYICRLSEALRLSSRINDFYCICIRDRIRDERETEELLSGMIIVNEDLDLVELFSEIQETFLQIIDWHRDMQDALINQKSIQDIISLSEPIIGNFISVSDSSLSLLAYTKNIKTDDPTSLFLIEHGYHSEEVVNKFKKFKRYETWMHSDGIIINTDGKISKYTVISKVFIYNETYFTHVVMTTTHREMTPGLIDLFSHLISILDLFMKQYWEEKKNYDHVYSSIVVDLLRGTISDRESVNERARIVGIKPDEEYIVMLLTGGDRGNSIIPGLMAKDISKKFNRIRAVYVDCRLMLFLHHSNIMQFFAEQNVEQGLNKYFNENNVFCGISEIFKDLMELPKAAQQAELALKESDAHNLNSGARLDMNLKYSNIAYFDNYFPSCLLDKSEEKKQLWMSSRYGRMLFDLHHADQDKNTNNLEVLYTYLLNERRATETATDLHMHRNNVIYRITRIEEMLHINLDDKLTRVNLSTSFLMLKYSGLIKPNEVQFM